MKIRWLARLLLPVLRSRVASRDPDFCVNRDGGEEIYLRRWWVVPRNGVFNLYLHQMLLDDDDVLHDHPYWSLSLVLTDGLEEVYCRRPSVDGTEIGDDWYVRCRRRVLAEGQVVWRSSVFAHQLVVRSEAWTLFFTGPRVREWGFWCPRGWRPWHQYVDATQDPSVRGAGVGSGSSRRGRGCGEV